MESKIFYSTKCYNFFENSSFTVYPKTIYLGNNNNQKIMLYMFFEANEISSNAIIESAFLFFYENNGGNSSDNYQVYITPTIDYINPFYYKNNIVLDKENKELCLSSRNNYLLKIDMKNLVEKWVDNSITNYGCIMELDEKCTLKSFSGVTKQGVEPFLKVTFSKPEGKIFCCFDDEVRLESTAIVN